MFKLIPYTKELFPDSIMASLYHRVVDEGLDSWLFYDGCISSVDEFMQLLEREDSHFFVLIEGIEPAALVWLNRAQMKFMQFHFCIFKKFWGKKSHEFAPKILSSLVSFKGVGGDYIIDALVGIVPVRNALACRYVTRWGEKVGVLPKGAYNARTRESEPAIIVSFTRDDIPEGLDYESLLKGGT